MNDEKLKTIAVKVIDKAGLSNEPNYGSVVVILMVISIVLTCIRVLQECNKNKLSCDSSINDKCQVYGEQIRFLAKKRGWFTKMRIKRILKRELPPEEYNKHSLALLSSIMSIGEDLTDDEVFTLVEAANV